MSRFTEIVNQTAERERKNHYIINIMLTALLSLVMIICLAGGVNVDVGTTVKGDGEKVMVRHNVFQLIDVVFSGTMSKTEAKDFVEKTNRKLELYGVTPPSLTSDPLDPKSEKTPVSPFFDDLAQLHRMIGSGEGQITAKQASKINFLKYKYAYAIAIGNTGDIDHTTSWPGHIAVTLVGQAILTIMPQVLLFVVSFVMLIHSIIALIKRKENKRAKFSLMLLGMGLFMYITVLLLFGFYSPDASGILLMILIPLGMICYALVSHAMLEKRDFSKSMFVHNGILLLGSLLLFILFMSPIFKVTNNDGGVISRGWSYLYDVSLADGMYFSSPMAYFLLSVIALVIVLPGILFMILSLVQINKFLSCDYGHNESRVALILTTAVNVLIFLFVGVAAASGAVKSSSYYMGATAKLNILLVLTEMLVLGGLIAMEYLYKVKPVKKELVIR